MYEAYRVNNKEKFVGFETGWGVKVVYLLNVSVRKVCKSVKTCEGLKIEKCQESF